MLSSRFRLGILAFTMLATAGCGYSPAYMPQSTASTLRGQISMRAPGNLNEFDFVRQLDRRLGHAAAGKYRLEYSINTSKAGVGVTPNQEIIRNNLHGIVHFTLKNSATGQIITQGDEETFVGYSVGSVDVSATPPGTNATIATTSAEHDAYSRLMKALADQVASRIVLMAGAAQP